MLKESHYRKLYSQSGQCLKICNKELSYFNLNRKYPRATPRLFSLYQMTVNYYKTMTEHVYAMETPDIRANTLADHKNVMITFVRTNKYKVSLNFLSNCLPAISNIIPKNCLSHSKDKI
jgi:hypothetical protein